VEANGKVVYSQEFSSSWATQLKVSRLQMNQNRSKRMNGLAYRLEHYDAGKKARGSRTDDIKGFSNVSNSSCPGVSSASNRNEYQRYKQTIQTDRPPLVDGI
jgi:hypothetical protein